MWRKRRGRKGGGKKGGGGEISNEPLPSQLLLCDMCVPGLSETQQVAVG